MALYKPTATGNQAFSDGTFFTDSSGFAEPSMLQIQRLRFQNTEIKKLYLGGTRVFGVVSPTHVASAFPAARSEDVNSITFAFTVPNGVPNGFLVLWLFMGASAPVPTAVSATWRGAAMTKATGISATQNSNSRILQCFYQSLPSAGSGNVVANFSGTASRLFCGVSLYRNVTPMVSVAQQYNAISAFSVTSGFNGTRSEGNRIICAAMHADTPVTLTTLNAGTRLHAFKAGAHQSMSGFLTSTSAGAFAASWTAGSNEIGDPGVGQWIHGGLQLNHD